MGRGLILATMMAVAGVAVAGNAMHDGGMSGHMKMTTVRAAKPGDKGRADAVEASARKVMEHYMDYRKALGDGYTIFMPDAPQPVYHFTLGANAMAAEFGFDAEKPTSLLYEKTGPKAYKLVGVMYTAPFRASEDQLNARIPLSVAQWHLHTNLCMPANLSKNDVISAESDFGFAGKIDTPAACKAAGGIFRTHAFGWMVHVYAFEKDPKKVWSAGMDDAHNMNMGAGMKM